MNKEKLDYSQSFGNGSFQSEKLNTVFLNSNNLHTNNRQKDNLFISGLTKYSNNEIDEAIRYFQAAIEMDPTIASYHSYLGLSMLKKDWNCY
jgi:hypothetical protein